MLGFGHGLGVGFKVRFRVTVRFKVRFIKDLVLRLGLVVLFGLVLGFNGYDLVQG